MRMDMFQRRISEAVKLWKGRSKVSSDDLALKLGITRGTFYAKLGNHRPWMLDDVRKLAALGVPVPPLTTPTTGPAATTSRPAPQAVSHES